MDKAAKRLAVIYVVLFIVYFILTFGVLRESVRAGKISGGAAVIHGILQFLFLADVLDAMYLAAGKWGRGKKVLCWWHWCM